MFGRLLYGFSRGLYYNSRPTAFIFDCSGIFLKGIREASGTCLGDFRGGFWDMFDTFFRVGGGRDFERVFRLR